MKLESFIAGCVACVSLVLSACGGAQESAPAAPSHEEPPTEPPAPAKPAPAAASKAALRCGDFITRADLKELGIEAPSYDEDVTQSDPTRGVICIAGPVTAGIFLGDVHETMMNGLKAAGEKSGVKLSEGPSVGAASQWTAMGTMHSLMFTVTSKSHTANVSGEDKALVEKVARFLDDKLR